MYAGHGLHAGECPRGGEPVVDRAPLGGCMAVGGFDGADAGFEFQRGRDSIQSANPQPGNVHRVAVQVDESSCHNVASDVEVERGWPERFADLGDAAAGERDVDDLVATGFGIDDPAGPQHDVVDGHRRVPVLESTGAATSVGTGRVVSWSVVGSWGLR